MEVQRTSKTSTYYYIIRHEFWSIIETVYINCK
jgi:hypothetical protein